MISFPTPPPDRRIEQKNHKNTSVKSTVSGNKLPYINQSTHENILEFEKLNNINMVKIKHIEDMRNNIFNYKVLQDKQIFLSQMNNTIPINHCNIILFGPSGSGKSSFIRSMYKAIYNSNILPPQAIDKLVIKDTSENEGTLFFTRLHLKEEDSKSSGITICDTRGQIWMSKDEKEQYNVILEGKAKEGKVIEQDKSRNPFLLWEFWKNDEELFPKDIFNNSTSIGLGSIPHCVIFVFDGSKDIIIDSEDEKFYKDLIDIAYKKGYQNVHVILTRIDVFEKNISEKNKKITPSDLTNVINNCKDNQIEQIMSILKINRSNVHFIENYHGDCKENIIDVDYHALKTLYDIINSSEQFLINYLNKSTSCFAKCF